jgi:hypothetical protein
MARDDYVVRGPFRRVVTVRHYGPGPHPGTGTEQTVHAGGQARISAEDTAQAKPTYGVIEHFGGQWDHSAQTNWDEVPEVQAAEAEVAPLDHERLVIVDKLGMVRVRVDGAKESITIPDADDDIILEMQADRMENILIHNHPNDPKIRGYGGTLSFTDVETAIARSHSEVRAVSSEAVYIMRFAPGFDEGDWERGGLTLDPQTGATVTTGEHSPEDFAMDRFRRQLSGAEGGWSEEGHTATAQERLEARVLGMSTTWAELADRFPQFVEYEIRNRP